MEATGERAEPRGLVRVRRRQRAGEDGIRRLLPSPFDRGRVVLAEPLEGGRPRVALVRHELVQDGQRDRLRAVGLVGDRAGEPGGARERRLAREEVRELELGARPGFEPSEELQDRAAVVDDGGVALLARDRTRPRAAPPAGSRPARRVAANRNAPRAPGERRAAPDRLEQGQAECRLGHRVDERLLAGARWRDGDAVALALPGRRRPRRTGRGARSFPAPPRGPPGPPRPRPGSCSPNHRRLPRVSRSAAAAACGERLGGGGSGSRTGAGPPAARRLALIGPPRSRAARVR